MEFLILINNFKGGSKLMAKKYISRTSLNELRKRDIYLSLGLICSDINSSEVTLCHENNIKEGTPDIKRVNIPKVV